MLGNEMGKRKGTTCENGMTKFVIKYTWLQINCISIH